MNRSLKISVLYTKNLSPPMIKTSPTLGDRAFIAAAPKLWNALPYDVRSTSNFSTFKQKLKTALFIQAYK